MSEIVKAVLGPTNTGKTHFAIERMLSYSSGVMGFPLRLLAREVYDRVARVKGVNQTALITGEERIIPEGARYFCCTVESMPRHKITDFVAIDEIQMAADPMRGHVFTEHLLATRGKFETLFLGADTIAPLIRRLLPEVEIINRPRLSILAHVKPTKLRRLPRRSAIVAFSAADVYGLAELIRRDKGGAAIVMGALSPRTRNAQVAMYQSGEVDYMVATDAIGMGLNLDLNHIAFNDLVKFDGKTFRELTPAEAAQIAGRAGRFKRDGTFSTLSGSDPFDPLVAAQIEDHTFQPIKALQWRNTRLDFRSPQSLIRSLEKPTDIKGLSRQRDALDLMNLHALAKEDDIKDIATTPDRVQLLWDVCQVPDFRKLGSNDHLSLLKRMYGDLTSPVGKIDEDLISQAVKRLDKVNGDIDTLADRLASVRVWTYVSHRSDWLRDANHWAAEARQVEDRLSDALHEGLTQRFVDRRTSVLMKSLKQKDTLRVEIDKSTGRVSVEGHEIGTLKGFSFHVDAGAARDDQKTLSSAAETGLRAEISRRAKLFANVGFKTLELDLSAGVTKPVLTLEGVPIFGLEASGTPLGLRPHLQGQTLLTSEEQALVLTKAQDWLNDRIAEKLEKLVALSKELNGEIEAPEGAEPLSGLARGIAYRLLEGYGTLDRGTVDQDLRQLDQDARKSLRRFGVRFGATSLYIPHILKPHATELRLIMWAFDQKLDSLPAIPTPGMVWVETNKDAPDDFYTLAGFRLAGGKAVRMDMLERLADEVRPLGSKGDWFPVTPEIMGLVGLSGDDFAAVMDSLGYGHETRTESKADVRAEQIARETAAQAARVQKSAPKNDLENKLETSVETDPGENTNDTAGNKTETASTEDPTSPSTDPEPTTQSTSEPTSDTEAPESGDAEDDTIQRLYFKWRANRRKTGARGKKRDGAAGSESAGRAAGGARKNASANRAARFDRKGSQKPTKGGSGAQGPAKPRKEKKADPDSPFAALAGLKDALQKKG